MLPCAAATLRRPSLGPVPNRDCLHCRPGPAFGSEKIREPLMPAVKSVPEGYPSLSPYLIVRDGAAAIDFYQKVFGATLRMKLDAPGGRVGHAELEIGNGLVMLADE